MTDSDKITLIGVIVTVLSTIVTIFYAYKAKTYKEQIQFDIRKINLSNIVEKLKRTQDEIRVLPKSLPIQRGIRVIDIIKNIKSHFDYVLNTLDSDGPESEIRTLISSAQSTLNNYEVNFALNVINSDDVMILTECMQDAIAKSNTKILKLEKDL